MNKSDNVNKNNNVNNEAKPPRVGRFAEIGAVVVEWGSEAHQQMIHSALRQVVNQHAGQTPSAGQDSVAEQESVAENAKVPPIIDQDPAALK